MLEKIIDSFSAQQLVSQKLLFIMTRSAQVFHFPFEITKLLMLFTTGKKLIICCRETTYPFFKQLKHIIYNCWRSSW